MTRKRWICLLLLALPSGGEVAAQVGGRVTGTVTDATGAPLVGAAVNIGGQGAVTDSDGRYTFASVPAGRHAVRVSFVGYAPQTRQITVVGGQPATVNLQLAAEAVQLEGVVAVGYGTQRRRDVTGAISSVNVDEIATIATTSSAGQLLQGRVAGAQVVQNNGAPGAGISIRIRGSNSIGANSEPLYVIDGMPAYVGSGSNDSYQNPLAVINPQDIESIEVLKDASATAIYGARGSNGVVLITTKLGRRGQSDISFESTVGMQEPVRLYELLDARQYAELTNEGLTNIGQKAVYSEAQIQAMGPGTDWQDEIFRSAPMQSHTMSFSGGNDQTRYWLSGSYFGQDGTIIGSEFKRYSARVNLDQTLSERLRVGTNFTVSTTESDRQLTDNAYGNGTVMGALWFNPVSPVRDPDSGQYVFFSPVTWPVSNPVSLANELINNFSRSAMVGNAFGELELMEGLRFRTSLGANLDFERSRYYASRNTPFGNPTNGNGNQDFRSIYNILNENILNFTRAVRDTDRLDATGGFTIQSSRNEVVTAAGESFVNDITNVYSLGAGAIPSASTGYSDWTLLSWLGRANYSLLDRYIFTVTGRFDGSSRFGENQKWAFFPSAAAAWRVLEEPFMRNQGLFSDLKLRFGYGVTGNQEIGLYQSLARLITDNYVVGSTAVTGYTTANSAPNPDLKWETTRQLNGGIDFGFLDNRLTGSVDAYHSVTDDLLLSVDLPATSGFVSQLRNVGSVENNGLELTLETVNIDHANLAWESRLTLAGNRNKVLDLGGDNELAATTALSGNLSGAISVLRVGEPIASFVGTRVNGIYQADDPCPLTARRRDLDCIPGEFRYVDVNGDGRINSDDRVLLGNGYPDFYGGLTNTVRLGRFDLSVFLQGSYGNEVLNVPAINIRSGNTTLSNQTVDILERWTPTNTDTDVPRSNALRIREITHRQLEDGSFLRLQDVTLGFRIPDRVVPGTTDSRLYVSGQNLHVWTKYQGFDPEVNSFGGEIVRGIDLGAYPRSRVVNVGLRATF